MLERKTRFDVIENLVILQTISRENRCQFCLEANSRFTVAAGQVQVDLDRRLKDRKSLDDPRLEALRVFTKTLVNERGWVSDTDVENFLSSGFYRAQVRASRPVGSAPARCRSPDRTPCE